MSPLADILYRNQGSVLTPELIHGLLVSNDVAMSAPIISSVPTLAVDQPELGDPRPLTNDRERVGKWVAGRVDQHAEWGSYVAIGLLNDAGELVAGVVLNDLTETNASIHVAFADRYALKRVFIYAVFDFAFRQLGLKRLTGYVEADNTDALTFDQHLGFELEHTIHDGSAKGDVHMLVMWASKCRWLRGND
jgi:RimJ/RimL family protein N-acetyltransferase